jgi:hypothetical protein
MLDNADEVLNVMDSFNGPITNFIQTKETTFLKKGFKNHHIFIDRVKNLTNLWEAKNYDEFSRMTLEELNRFAGRRKQGKIDMKKDVDLNKFFQKLHSQNDKLKSAEMFKFRSIRRSSHKDEKYPQFPKNYEDNKKYLHPARNQVRNIVYKGFMWIMLRYGNISYARI